MIVSSPRGEGKKIQTSVFGVPEYEISFVSSYCPRIEKDLMIQLMRVKKKTGEPIVKLVNKAVKKYLKRGGDSL
jgi:hypothetical protein